MTYSIATRRTQEFDKVERTHTGTRASQTMRAIRESEPYLKPLVPEGPRVNPIEQIEVAIFASRHYPGVDE